MVSISPLEMRINRFIGAKLRKVRSSQKFSLIQLASMMDVSYQQLQKYETGINRVSAARLIILVYILGKENEDFFHKIFDELLPEIKENQNLNDVNPSTFKLIEQLNNDLLTGLR